MKAHTLGCCLMSLYGLLSCCLAASAEATRSVQIELPNQDQNVFKLSLPSIGCWFWTKAEFEPDGYKRFLDYNYQHSPFQLLTTRLRSGDEVTDERVRRQLFEAAKYAEWQRLKVPTPDP